MSGPDWWRVGEALFALLLFVVALLVVVLVLDVLVRVACGMGVLDGGC